MNITKDAELLREQTRLTAAKADLAEIKLALQRGEVVKLSEVQKEWKAGVSNVRKKLLGLPDKVSYRLAGLEIREINAILTGEIYEVLNELAEEYR